nr:MAG TPA: hypothetical protein [Caudoviricetes sp.]
MPPCTPIRRNGVNFTMTLKTVLNILYRHKRPLLMASSTRLRFIFLT